MNGTTTWPPNLSHLDFLTDKLREALAISEGATGVPPVRSGYTDRQQLPA
jgi:hypothetical protein